MNFVTYTPSNRGPLQLASGLLSFEARLLDNVDKFDTFYQSEVVVFNNQHALSKVINLLEEYFGDTPKDTYNNVVRRLKPLCGSLGIVHIQGSCEISPIIGDSDVLIYKEVENLYWAGSMIDTGKSNRPVFLAEHNEISLHLDHYLQPLNNTMGLWYVDLPYLAALYHQLSTVKDRSHSAILTKLFYRDNARRIMDIAVANNIPTWIGDDFVIDLSESAPYFQHNLTQLGNQLQRDWKRHFEKYSRAGVSELATDGVWGTVTAPTSSNKIKTLYVDHLLWVNAYIDMKYLNRLKRLNTTLSLDIKLDSVVGLPKRLLTATRVDSLTRTIPGMSKVLIQSELSG